MTPLADVCTHAAARALATDNDGRIYIARSPAKQAGDDAWCPACGALRCYGRWYRTRTELLR